MTFLETALALFPLGARAGFLLDGTAASKSPIDFMRTEIEHNLKPQFRESLDVLEFKAERAKR
jgi:hypothetical protein